MKFNKIETSPKSTEKIESETSSDDISTNDVQAIQTEEEEKGPVFAIQKKQNNRFYKVPLTEEDKNLSVSEYAQKHGIGNRFAYDIKKQGYRNIREVNHINTIDEIKKRSELKTLLKEVSPLQIKSLETIWGNTEEQAIIKEVIKDYYSHLKYENTKGGKRFKLINGKEVSLGDLVTIDKLIQQKVFRNEKGELMMFDEKENDFVKFNPTNFFGKHKTYSFNDNIDNIESTNPRAKYYVTPLETFAPEVYKSGFFKEEDFNKRIAGSFSYLINGPHERTLSKTRPSVSFSNSVGRCSYYIGRKNFTGTNKKINYETVRVALLDDSTGVITDNINGRKMILYTFPLLTKDEVEKKKLEIIKNKTINNKINDIKVDDFVTAKATLKEYFITDYVAKNKEESDIDYTNRISKLSDTTYVLGNFKSFMSETGLAANNYSWREQLILADALTSVNNKDKIINFGKNYKKDGLRTFLSVEHGGQKMGNKILVLGEKLPEDTSKIVFAKYGEIINTADNIEEEIKKIFGDKDVPGKVIYSVKETLLKRGARMLSDLSDKVLNPGFKVNEIEILQELNEIKEETIILGQSYISLYKEGIKVPIEEVTTIKEAPVTDFNEKQKGDLLKIYENGRPKVTYERMEHLEFLKEEFKGELNDKNTSVFEICFNNETIIIALVENKDKDTLHIGGLTFVEDVKNAVIAEASMSYVLKRFEDKNIKALVDSRNPLLNMYLKRFGFKITKKLDSPEEIKNNGGEIYYEVEKTKELKIDQKTVEKQEFDKAA